MISFRLTASSATSLSIRPPLVSTFKPSYTYHLRRKLNQRKVRNGTCRAEFSHDAPFGVAIGACILNSLAFPIPSGPEEGESDSVIDSADARFAVMAIVSFIPFFNWMSWVFAWLDTGKRRYVVYAIVYLAPYLRSNFSLSPEESWLPIASIVFCIIHIQLEASIKNGDLQGFQLFSEAAKHLSSVTRKKEFHSKGHQRTVGEDQRKDEKNPPSAEEQSRTDIRWWGVPGKSSDNSEHLNEDEETNEAKKH